MEIGASGKDTVWSACRDCLSGSRGQFAACPSCGSVRMISHPRLFELGVAHIDCDAFYASVEKRDRPELAGLPVIVGGGRRGVVATCCYMARTYGVRSAMPMFQALRACPEAVVIRPRMQVYLEAARRIRTMMSALTPLVEPVSIDEAYLDLSGTTRLHGCPPAITLMKLQSDVEREMQLTISVGLACNKFLAKIASEADKPRGFFCLSLEEAPAYLAPKSVRMISGVGAQFEKRLSNDGIRTVGDIQRTSLSHLVKRYGEMGPWLHERAFGRHGGAVNPDGERKSVSSETTFAEDIREPELLEDILWRQCQRTADRAKGSGVEGRIVTLKLKTSDFRSFTRRASLSEPTQLAQTIFRAARQLLLREKRPQAYRLIGVGLSDLTMAKSDAIDLGDPTAIKRARAERAADSARGRFGEDAVMTGRGARIRRSHRKR